MNRHTVHTRGKACTLCRAHRRVVYVDRTAQRRPLVVLVCDRCDWMPAGNAPDLWPINEGTAP